MLFLGNYCCLIQSHPVFVASVRSFDLPEGTNRKVKSHVYSSNITVSGTKSGIIDENFYQNMSHVVWFLTVTLTTSGSHYATPRMNMVPHHAAGCAQRLKRCRHWCASPLSELRRIQAFLPMLESRYQPYVYVQVHKLRRTVCAGRFTISALALRTEVGKGEVSFFINCS